jgi:5-(carboxyamino)imidazole ribonucleotide synthase
MQSAAETVIGIIGDGQLALMLAESLHRRGIGFKCLKQSENSPMERTFPTECTSDPELFRKLCDVFTLENEFLKVSELQELLGEKSDRLFPRLESYSHFADKVSQRKLYESLGLLSPKWMEISHQEQTSEVLRNFSFPFMVKASAGGYDGKGIRVVRTDAEFAQVQKDFGLENGKTLLVEEMVKIKREVAQGFLRNNEGNVTFLPLVDTIQENGICNFVFYPAQVSEAVAQQVESMLTKLSNHPLIGIFNFEFFVGDKDQVYINEGAPRPHNSQHLTINASLLSQFDLLGLYLLGATDVPQKIRTKNSAMINILGQSSGSSYELKLPEIKEEVEIFPKLYAKEKSSPGRKMGHVNIVDRFGEHNLGPIARKIFEEYKL